MSTKKDGLTFALVPEIIICSPLDVPSIKAKVTTEEIVNIVREGRERQHPGKPNIFTIIGEHPVK